MSDPITDFLRVSYSSLNVFDACPRKFEFTKLYPRRARDGDTYAADVGTALHAGYQTWLSHPEMDTETRFEAGMWALMRKFPYAGEYVQKTDHRSFEAAISTLQSMIDSAPMVEYELAKIKRPNTAEEIEAGLTGGVIVPAVEVPFEIRFKGITLPDGRGIAFTGFIDALLRNLVNGRYKTMDIKTHRANMNDATGKYKFNGQQLPYGIVLEHVQGNPVDSFDVLYLDCYIDLVEPRIELYEFAKDSEAVREWLINKVLTFQQIERFSQMDYFPRTEGGCVSFNRPCWYLEPCQSRDKGFIEEWLMMGEQPEQRPQETPWIVAEIDLGI